MFLPGFLPDHSEGQVSQSHSRETRLGGVRVTRPGAEKYRKSHDLGSDSSSGMRGVGWANGAASDEGKKSVLDRPDFRWFQAWASTSGSTEKVQPIDDPCFRSGGWLYACL